jgi:hypothetical protein
MNKIVKNYRIVQKIGQGEHGSIYLVEFLH